MMRLIVTWDVLNNIKNFESDMTDKINSNMGCIETY